MNEKKLDNSQNINEVPGTLHYRGKYRDDITVEVIEYDQYNFSRYELDSISEFKANEKVQWINIIGLNDISMLEYIGELFNIHRIDLEDILNVSQRSKIEQKEDYLFSIYKMVYLKEGIVIHEHVSILMADQILLTFQEAQGDVFDPIRKRLQTDGGQIRKLSVDYLYYSLVDCLIDQYFEICTYVQEIFSEAETLILEGDNKSMDHVYILRKELIYLKNAIVPIRDSLSRFLKSKNQFISEDVSPYFSDVLDNTLHALDAINTFREMANSLYEMQITKASNDMNKIMMTLTVFSAIFIPLSFLAGVFGMNFNVLPGITSKYSFVLFITGCFLIICIMIWFFKRKKWF